MKTKLILQYATPIIRQQIVNALKIDRSTYYRKVSVKIGEDRGFTSCQLLVTSEILKKPMKELLTDDSANYYKKLA